MPNWADVTNEGFVQVADPAAAVGEPPGAALPDRPAAGVLARAVGFGITAIRGLAAIWGIAAAALPDPPPAAPPTVTSLTAACRAPPPVEVPRRVAVATPPPASTAAARG